MHRNVFLTSVTAILCFLAVGSTVPADDSAPAKPKAIDLSHVSSKSFFAIYLQPRQTFAHKRSAPEIVAEALDEFKQMTGIDAGNLNQVIIQGVKRDDEPFDDDHLVFVFRCDKAVDSKAIREKLEATTEAEVNNKKYFQPARDHRPSIYFADDRTFVIGMKPQLEQVLSEDDVPSPLIRRLKTVDAACDAAFVMAVTPIRAEMVGNIEHDRSPGPHKAFGIDLFNNVEAVTVVARLSADVPLTTVLETTDDPKAAAKVEDVTNNLLAFLKANYKNEREQMLARAGEFPLAKVAVAVFDKMLAGVQIKREENRVVVSVEAKGGMPDALDVLLGMFVVRGSASSATEAAPPSIERTKDFDR